MQESELGAAVNYTPVPDFSEFTPNQEAWDATVEMMEGAGINNTEDYIDVYDASFQNGIIDSLFLNQLSLSKFLNFY